MRKYLFLILIVAVSASASEEKQTSPASGSTMYRFELSQPAIRITLPNLPRIEMLRHPLNGEKPHLRMMGNNQDINVLIITPTAEPGMTPIDCASASATSILARYEVQPQQVFRGRADENTFLLIYGYPQGEFVLLNAHVLSASKAGYCVEVHVSKISTSEADVSPWFNGFGESKIEEF